MNPSRPSITLSVSIPLDLLETYQRAGMVPNELKGYLWRALDAAARAQVLRPPWVQGRLAE